MKNDNIKYKIDTMNKRQIRQTLIVFFLMSTLSVQSEEFCVTTSQELFTSLFTAGVNGEDDHIKIAQGNYIAPKAGWKYLELPSETFDIKISGGWSDFFNNPCGQNLGGSPLNTTLDANSQGRVMSIEPQSDTKIEISGINFVNGLISDPKQNSGGLLIDSDGDMNHDVLIERSSFINNSAFATSALYIRSAEKVILRNSFFILNNATKGKVTVNIGGVNKIGFYVTNNTIIDNEGGLFVYAHGMSQAFVANNHIWDNDDISNQAYDLSFQGSGFKYDYNNNYYVFSGMLANVREGRLYVDPAFEEGLLNITPSINSQLVGAGRNSPNVVPIPTPFNLAWNIGALDFEGNPRRVGDEIDIGAVESSHQMYIELPIFADGFEG